MTFDNTVGESDVCVGVRVNSPCLSEGVWSQSIAHPEAHPSSDLTAASHRETERKNRNRLVHHYGQHRLTDQQGIRRPSLPMKTAHTQREIEIWCLTFCLIMATKSSIVLVNRIQMSSCLIQCLTLSGCSEGQRIRLSQFGHLCRLLQPFMNADLWLCPPLTRFSIIYDTALPRHWQDV